MRVYPFILVVAALSTACTSVTQESKQHAFKIKPTTNSELIHAASAAEYEQLGNRYAAAHNVEMAITAYKKALAKEPNRASVLQKLSGLLMQQNRTEEAITSLELLVAQQPSAKNCNNLGFAYYQSGDYEKATRLLNQAITLDSQYIKAKNNLALLQMSIAASQTAPSDTAQATMVAAAPLEAGATLEQKNKYVYGLAYNDSKPDPVNVATETNVSPETTASTTETTKPATNMMGIIIAVLTVILLL